jgi:hypothetical protein
MGHIIKNFFKLLYTPDKNLSFASKNLHQNFDQSFYFEGKLRVSLQSIGSEC